MIARSLQVVLVGVVALAASSAFGSAPPLAAPVETITVGAAANGTVRALRRGDRLVVRLPSNPSTGYGWVVRAGTGRVLVLVARAYLPPQGSALVGAPGTAVLRLRAAAAGRTTLRLWYVRSWEKGAPPARTFSLRVRVT